MPAKYEAIKAKLMQQGLSEEEAEKRAAKIYNAQRKKGQKPMGPYFESKTKGFGARPRR